MGLRLEFQEPAMRRATLTVAGATPVAAKSAADQIVGRSRYAEEMRRKSCDWIRDLHLAAFGEGDLLDQPL
jgi:hypothetical protein